MEENFTINEILSAVDEIQKKKKVKKIEIIKNNLVQKDFSDVPKKNPKVVSFLVNR